MTLTFVAWFAVLLYLRVEFLPLDLPQGKVAEWCGRIIVLCGLLSAAYLLTRYLP